MFLDAGKRFVTVKIHLDEAIRLHFMTNWTSSMKSNALGYFTKYS